MAFRSIPSHLFIEETYELEHPLAIAAEGDEIIILKVNGGKRLNQRLSDLGLHTGSKMRVVRNSRGGPMILAVKDDSRIALGRGMAQQIIVKQIHLRKL